MHRKIRLDFRMFCYFISGLLLSFSISLAQADMLDLSELGWNEKSFAGNTKYSTEQIDGINAIRASASGTASALYKKKTINLDDTPYISWQWKIRNTYDNGTEREKSGDDFPARVYVVYRSGLFGWSTLAINYVWSSSEKMGASWKSAYTNKSHVVVLRTGDEEAGKWMTEKRNVVQDFRDFFGVDVNKLDGVALMVDGDNTSSAATSWFADIDFTAE